MRTWHTTLAAGVLVTLVAVVASSQAQQVTVGAPFHNLSDSFFENNTVGWSGHYRGINFSYGSAPLALPQFGLPDKSAGLSANFAFAGKDGQINFYTNFSQGYRQSLVTQTPSVTMMNGQTGYVSDSSQVPFVMSVVPVVGAFPQQPQQMSGSDANTVDPRIQAMLQARAEAQTQAQSGGLAPPPPAPQNRKPPDPDPAPPTPGEAAEQRLDAASESSAGRPALSVAEAKRLHQQEQAAAGGEMAALMERARALEEDGKPNVAKIYYQRIAKHATGELQQQARTRLYELQGKP